MERLTWVLEGVASSLPALAAAGIVVAYGFIAARMVGMPSRLLAIGAAVPLAIALLAISAQAAGMLGLAMPIVAHSVTGLGLAAVLRALTGRWRAAGASTEASDPGRIVWIGVAIGTLATLGVWVAGIGDHGIPPQGHDDIWHGYLVERLTHMPLITAGTVAPTLADRPEPILYYQYALHLALALGHVTTGASVAETLNGGWIVHAALLLPVGAAALAWRLFPDRPWVACWAAVLSPGVVVFPYVTNGLLPYTASLAMIPGLLAALVAHVRGEVRVPLWVPAFGALGVFVTHPGGAVVAAIIAALLSMEALVAAGTRGSARAQLQRLATVSVVTGVVAMPWLLAAGARGLGSAPATGAVPDVLSAIWLVLTLGTPWTSPQPVIALFTAAGIVAVVALRRGVGLAAAWAVFAVLFVGTVVGLPGFAAVTQFWHAEWYRIVAALGVVVPVLAGLGVATAISLVHRYATHAPVLPRRAAGGVVAVIVLVVAMGAAYAAAQGQSIVRHAWHSGGLVQASDVQLFRELAELTGPGDRVFNSPRDGSSWMYALYEIVPMHPYIYRTPRWSWDLVNGLERYRHRSVACSRLEREELTHAVVKRVAGHIGGIEAYDIAGFVERHRDLFVEVTRTDTAVAYRIDRQALAECIRG